MVSLAHKFAFETPQIVVEAISAVAAPELAAQYQMLATPHVVLNKRQQVRGRIREEELLAAIMQSGVGPG